MKRELKQTNEKPNGASADHERRVASSKAGGRHSSTVVVQRATGPKTAAGKRRSSRNATKHGIFAQAVLASGESSQFDSILADLTEQRHPVGAVEQLLVEKMAIVLLRQERLYVAEYAEIRRSIAFIEWDENVKQAQELSEAAGAHKMEFDGLSSRMVPVGLLHKTENPLILRACLKYLIDLRERVATNGFDQDRDSKVLATLHGGPVGLWKLYLQEMQEADDERARGGHPSSTLSKEDALRGVDADIRELKLRGERQVAIETKRTELKRLSLFVPASPTLDRLMRYESHLSRQFDRLLNQLERLQSMRLELPGPPTLRVELDD